MKVLQGRGVGNGQHRTHKVPLPKGDEVQRRKSLFGSYTDVDMVLGLKELALDPCKPGASRESKPRLCNQILHVRKAMLLTNTESPRRKRKLQEFLKGKLATTSGLASDTYNQQICSKLSRSRLSAASSNSCVLNSADSSGSLNWQVVQDSLSAGSLLTSEENFKEREVTTSLPFLDNVIDFGPTAIKYSSSLIDSDESVNGSNPLTPENLTLHGLPSLDVDDTVESSHSSNLEEPKQLYIRRLPIPIGPRFQADVPDWTEPVCKEKLEGIEVDLENSRWLGTRVWPVGGGITEICLEEIGKGRPDSCSCEFPGSSDCVMSHILEKRLQLRSEIGHAFMSWKFDEMGEFALNSWALKEQKSLDSFIKQKWLTDKTEFWKKVSKCFPCKSKRSILNYYFNVFIPRRMSLQIKSSVKQVDSDDEESDDDEVEAVDHADSRERCKASESDGLGSSKDLRTHYLRQSY